MRDAASLRALEGRLKRGLERRVPMANLCTLKVGGPADFFAEPVDLEELHSIIRAAWSDELPILVIGSGSNLLVCDEGFPGVVVRLEGVFRRLSHKAPQRVESGGAVLINRLVERCLAWDLSGGIESLYGIPGTLGGAVRMNAGAHEREISNYIVKLECIHTERRQGEDEPQVYTLEAEELRRGFAYRTGPLARQAVLTKATLEIPVCADRVESKARLRQMKDLRKIKHPREPSAGSVFRNPPGTSAGIVIERCGCKGWREGDAEVSQKHANFIVNMGEASAGDLYRLAMKVRSAVWEKEAIELELEWKLVGWP